MQHAGVVAAGHDRAVGRATGTLLQEVLLNHGLHLPLIEARPNHLTSQLVGLGRDSRRLAHTLQLLGALAQPQLVQQRTGGHQAQGGPAAAGGSVELSGPSRQHQRLHLRVLANAKGDALSAPEVVGQALL